MKSLRGKKLLLTGFTLFSMFFGAGNLIFPPFLGAQAGVSTWPFAMLGMALSAIGFPVLGVVSVARSDGLDRLAGRVGPRFSFLFTLLIYLSIGPCLAIPRTASTSFEMAVPPFMGSSPLGEHMALLQFLYSLLFFGLAFLLALRPEKLTDRLGKILCPLLLALIVAVFAACVLYPFSGYGPASGAFSSSPFSQGFIDGYQTMDTIAALNFGIIIAVNIRAMGITDDRAVTQGTIRAGWIAGGMLLLVYSMLAHIGALSGTLFPGSSNGTEVLTQLIHALFGSWGSVVLALIFVIACFNTCVGLISCCSEYFHAQFPRLSYRRWAALFAAISLVISNAGLDLILKFSVPVLGAIYPVAIVLILLSFFQRWIGALRFVYPVSIAFTGVFSVLYSLYDIGFPLEPLAHIPLASLGLGWVLPALAGVAAGLFLSVLHRQRC